MTNRKTAVFSGAAIVLFLFLVSLTRAQIDTRRIDEVRGKGMLDSSDLETIDRFMAEAIREFTRTDDFSKIAAARATILSRTSTQAQYQEQFKKSSRQHIDTTLKRAANLPEQQRFMIVLNLLILIDNLDDPVLAEQAFDYVGTANTPLRYWAVRVITGPTLAKQALEKPQSDLAQRVLTTIRSLTNDPSPDILDLVVDFAAKQGGQPGQALLLDIADRRIARYRSGDVPDELLEIKLLKQLCARMTQDNPQKNIVAQRFTQLFDLVMQRYLEKQDTLSPDQKAKLVSVMAEIEDKCLPILLKQPQNNLRRALETGDMDRLQAERERLLGPSGVLKTL